MYGLLYIFFWVLALLPLKILYLFSDLLFIFCYYIAGYRKQQVLSNLKNAFPEKNIQEIKKIRQQFYRFFCDFIIENIKTIHLSSEQLRKRMQIKNIEILEKYYKQGKSIIAAFGHYANWEWLCILPSYTKYQVFAIYKPLSNNFFNNLVNKSRSKFGIKMLSMKTAYRSISEHLSKGEQILTLFLADQRPHKNEIRYRTKFLNQSTAVYLGVEKIARTTEQIVIFFQINKIKRGYYQAIIIPLFEHPGQTKDYEITDMHTQILEQIIKQKPYLWLWTHKRWKY